MTAATRAIEPPQCVRCADQGWRFDEAKRQVSMLAGRTIEGAEEMLRKT